MTQTSNPATFRTYSADEVTVTPGSSLGNSFILDFTDDNPSRVATIVTTRLGAEQMLRALAEQLGFRVLDDATAETLGAMVQDTISAADVRDAQNLPSTTGLNAHRDAMRDMRDEFRHAGVIS